MPVVRRTTAETLRAFGHRLNERGLTRRQGARTGRTGDLAAVELPCETVKYFPVEGQTLMGVSSFHQSQDSCLTPPQWGAPPLAIWRNDPAT